MKLTPAEIASMRATVNDTTLDMTCDIRRETPGALDSHGHETPGVWADISSDIPCHYWELTENELVGTPNATLTSERLLLPANTDVSNRDRITNVIGVDGTEVATNLDVLEVLKRPYDVLLIVRAIQ